MAWSGNLLAECLDFLQVSHHIAWGGGGGGVLRFQMTGMIEGYFWVLNFRCRDFVLVGKFGKYYFV